MQVPVIYDVCSTESLFHELFDYISTTFGVVDWGGYLDDSFQESLCQEKKTCVLLCVVVRLSQQWVGLNKEDLCPTLVGRREHSTSCLRLLLILMNYE